MIRFVQIALLFAVMSGCNEVLPKSDFAKFSACVRAATKDDIISKSGARTACAEKHSKFKLIDMTGTGAFSFCNADQACGLFSVDAQNTSQGTVITRFEIVVRSPNGKAVSGFANALWAEPGSSISSFVTLSEKLSPEERKGMTWSIVTIRGIDIEA